MWCPQCGSNQSDELKYCKLCGAHLEGVRQALVGRGPNETIDWSKTWVGEMFLSSEERERRKKELELMRGLTPEVRRYNEIKAGVITGSTGIGLAIFLYVFMQGIILGGSVDSRAAAILSNVWVAGVIPFFVGLALLINGVFVSKRLVAIAREASEKGPNILGRDPEHPSLRSADTSEFTPSGFSVTEETTKHLGSPGQKQ